MTRGYTIVAFLAGLAVAHLFHESEGATARGESDSRQESSRTSGRKRGSGAGPPSEIEDKIHRSGVVAAFGASRLSSGSSSPDAIQSASWAHTSSRLCGSGR